ncbi:rhodanese-like domain-containing protein [Rhodococcus sp. IEGM 1408]|uniref:rhodanese-like domain-containing protein n=1 Tax=Rhodococcus sp. IEGM 1408 TaxID=3082220 RepID=UPI002953C5CE|nr:rhodanese-like domain-containing protein [Rhodococcus sp. IEGM 1408]MDV8002323.1 rhodanese-like domain-containing protein [Rhodococcus sp. IEGM 1408]
MTTALTATASSATATAIGITLAVAGYRAAVEAGALVVDIRSRAQRERQGVLAGAVAVEARPVVDLLDPRSAAPLAAVGEGREVVLVSDDGLDAELFAVESHSRGVRGVRAVDGGHAALRAAGALGLLSDADHLLRERSAISAH